MSDRLTGSKAICHYLGISESQFMEYVVNRGLPAKRNADSVWDVSTKEVDVWNGQPEQEKGVRFPTKKSKRKERGK